MSITSLNGGQLPPARPGSNQPGSNQLGFNQQKITTTTIHEKKLRHEPIT